jgi:hypothetical protein
MKTVSYTYVTGTRIELLAELRRLAEGWEHLGKPLKVAEALTGITALTSGADTVDVGHSLYKVTEPTL